MSIHLATKFLSSVEPYSRDNTRHQRLLSECCSTYLLKNHIKPQLVIFIIVADIFFMIKSLTYSYSLSLTGTKTRLSLNVIKTVMFEQWKFYVQNVVPFNRSFIRNLPWGGAWETCVSLGNEMEIHDTWASRAANTTNQHLVGETDLLLAKPEGTCSKTDQNMVQALQLGGGGCFLSFS